MRELDQTDLRIIAMLQADGKTTNKRIATEVGVAEATVANRLKRLIAEGVLLSTVQRDIFALGYAFQAIVELWIGGRRVADVARDLARSDALSTVCVMQGSPEIVVVFNARDHAAAARIVADELASVRGVQRTELALTLGIYKSEASAGMIRNSASALRRAHRKDASRIAAVTA